MFELLSVDCIEHRTGQHFRMWLDYQVLKRHCVRSIILSNHAEGTYAIHWTPKVRRSFLGARRSLSRSSRSTSSSSRVGCIHAKNTSAIPC